MPHKAVRDLQPGDMLDLQNDKYADPKGEDIDFEYENCQVFEIEIETPGCWLVIMHDARTFGFPPDHMVKLAD